jgi:hypothetical protein
MRYILLIIPLFLVGNILSQDDSLNNVINKTFPKNQISTVTNIRMNDRNGPILQLNYLRLRDSEVDRTFANNSYYYVSLDLSGFSKPSVNFDKHQLMEISDSMITQRSFGSASSFHNLKFGIERQQRIMPSLFSIGGLQANVLCFGIIGYTKQIDQYVHTQQSIGGTTDGEFFNYIDKDYQKLPIQGERTSEYLRIGFGSSFGFDWVATLNDLNISLGLNMGLFNLSFAFLMDSETRFDPDNFYTNSPKKFLTHADLNLGIRVGVHF